MLPPATWYPDPSGRHEHRYWDGDRWTEHVADAGIAALDPLPVVTADEQVDGGVAADIAAVAMAATSTSEDPPDAGDHGEDRGRWRVGRGHGRRRGDRAPVIDGDDAASEDGPVGEPSEGDDPAAPSEDPWREAAAVGFVMPSDAIASLHARGSDASAPAFLGPDLDGTDVGADDGVALAPGGVTVALHLDGPGLVAATRAVRRIVGTCDLEPATPRWTRRIVGEGTVSLVPTGRCTVVAAPGVERILVRTDTFVATGGRATVQPAASTSAVDAMAITRADWLAVTAPAGPTTVTVDGARRLAAGHLVAWTDGLELVEDDGGVVLLRGRGSILVDGTLPT